MAPKNYHLDKFHIISSTESVVEEIMRLSKAASEERFLYNNGKWSMAENVEHLRLSLARSWQGLFVPKFITRRLFGKPDHESLPYEELMEIYNQRLEAGGIATKPYLPQIKLKTKEQVLDQFEHGVNRYLNEIRYYWEEHHLDQYQFPHPLLGKITARELMYFNLFHCWHHFRTMRQRNSEAY